jgi:hypothetical protein
MQSSTKARVQRVSEFVAVIEAEKKPSALYTGFKQKWLGRWSRFAEWRLQQPKLNVDGRFRGHDKLSHCLTARDFNHI